MSVMYLDDSGWAWIVMRVWVKEGEVMGGVGGGSGEDGE